MAAPIWSTLADLGNVYEDDNLLFDLDASDTLYYNLVALGTISLADPIQDTGTKIININGTDIQLGTTTAAQLDGIETFITSTEDTGIHPGKTFNVVDTLGSDVVTTKIVKNGSTAPTFPLTGSITLGTVTTNTGLDLTGVANISSLVSTLNATYNTGIYGIRASANLFTYSEQFDHANWTKSNAIPTANATTAPNGTVTADKLAVDTASVAHYALQTKTLTASTYTVSVYVKAAGFNWFAIGENFNTGSRTWFNISTGVLGTVDADHTAIISDVGNGWYKCSITFTATASSNWIAFYPGQADLDIDTAGDGSSGAYIWGAQLELAAAPTDYIQTVATADILRLTKYNNSGGTNLYINTVAITGGNLQLTDGTYYLGIQQIADNINNLPVKLTNNVIASVQGVAGAYYLRVADSVTAVSLRDNNSSINTILNIPSFSAIPKNDVIYELNAQLSTTGVLSYYTSNGFLEIYGSSILLDATNDSFDILELLGIDKVGGELLSSPLTKWLTIDESLGVLQGITPTIDITTPVTVKARAIRDSGLYFNGVDGYVDFGDVHDFTGVLPFSVELLFRYDGNSVGSFPGLITKESFGPRNGWGLSIDPALETVSFSRWLTDTADTISVSLTIGQKYHIAGTYDGTNMRLYLNGVLVAGPTASSKILTDNAGSLEIGKLSTNYFGGVIDEVRIWDDERTLTEINDNMYAELAGTEAGLVGYWKLDENTGSTTADSTTGAVTGTLIGGVEWSPGLVYTDRSFMLTLQPLNEAGQISWTPGLLGTFEEGAISKSSLDVQNFASIEDKSEFFVLKRKTFHFDEQLVEPWTFTRDSIATYIRSDGVVVTVDKDIPRYEFDTVTKQFKGLLVEPQRTNTITYSEQIDHTDWTLNNSSITANTEQSPDLFITADKIVEDATASTTHGIQQTQSFTTGLTYTVSVFAKASERTRIRLTAGNLTTFGASADFDLSAGTVAATTSGTASIINLGTGWYRCSIIGISSATAATNINVQLMDGAATIYNGDGISGAFIWGLQLEAGHFVTSYIKTLSAPLTRQADNMALELFNLDYRITVRGTNNESRTNVTVTNRNYNLVPVTNDRYIKYVTVDRYHQDQVYVDSDLIVTDKGYIAGHWPFHNYGSTRTYTFESVMAYKNALLLGPDNFSFAVNDTYADTTLGAHVDIYFDVNTRLRWTELNNELIANDKIYRVNDTNFGLNSEMSISVIDGLQNDTLSNFATSIQGQFNGFDVTIGSLQYASTATYDIIYYDIVDNGSTVENYTNPLAATVTTITPDLIEPESLSILRTKLITDIGFETAEIIPEWQLVWQPVLIVGYVNSGEAADIVSNFNLNTDLQDFIGKRINVNNIRFKKNDIRKFEEVNTTSSNYGLDFLGTSADDITFDGLTINETMTVEAWVSTTKVSDSSFILYWAETTGGDGLGTHNESHLGFSVSGGVQFFVRTAGTSHVSFISNTTTYEDGALYHVAVVMDNTAGTAEIFVNGVSDGTSTFTPGAIDFSAYTFMKIGGPDGGTTRWWDGIIDDVRIWDIAREQKQISDDMNKKLHGDEYGLIGYWKFDEGTGTIVHDITNSNNHGTLNGTISWITPANTVTETPYRFPDNNKSIGLFQKTNTLTSSLYGSVPDYSMYHQFAGSTTLEEARIAGPAITFTRASIATYYDKYGVLRTAAANEARFDYNSVTLTAKGLLIEESRENLILQSEDFSTTWSIGSITVTSNQISAPDGNTTADLITYAGAAVQPGQTITITASDTVVLSAFVKKSNIDYVRLSLTGAPDTLNQYFNINTGVVASQTGAIGTSLTGISDARIENIGNGWYRVFVTITTAIVTSLGFAIVGSATDGGASAATDEFYVWGAQVEVANTIPQGTSYIPTTTTTVIRALDSAKITITGLSSFNATEGTIMSECYRDYLDVTSSMILSLDDGTLNNRIVMTVNGGTGARLRVTVVDSSVTQWSNTNVGESTGYPIKVALAYKASDFAAVIDGGTVATQTSGTVPTVTQMVIGDRGAPSTPFNGYISAVYYWPTRRTGIQLQSDTS